MRRFGGGGKRAQPEVRNEDEGVNDKLLANATIASNNVLQLIPLSIHVIVVATDSVKLANFVRRVYYMRNGV